MPSQPKRLDERMNVRVAQRWLALVWFLGAAVPCFFLIRESFADATPHFDMKLAWGWFWPYVTPTLTLMVGVLGIDELRSELNTTVPVFSFVLTLCLSVCFLFVLAFVPVLHELFEDRTPEQLMVMLLDSKLFLDPLNALVGGSLAIFFTSRKA